MSTTAVAAGAAATGSVPQRVAQDLSFARVVRSEWIKFRSLRSNWGTLLGILVVILGFGLIATMVATGKASPTTGRGPDFAGRDPLSLVLAGTNLALLVVGVLGAVGGAREYASGMIRSSVTAVPSRLPLLWAKVLVFVVAVVPVLLVATVLAFFAGMHVLKGAGLATVSWSDPGVARMVLGTSAYIAGLGIIGLSLGVLFRSIAAGIGSLIGGILFLPALAGLLLPSSWSHILKYLPSNAGLAFTSSRANATLLGASAGAWVFAAWVVGTLALAAVALRMRDV